MNVKSVLKIVIPSVLIISVIFSILIYLSLEGYKSSLAKVSIAQEIVLEVFQRRILAEDYLATQTDRAKAQWYDKQDLLKKIVTQDQNKFTIPAEKESLKQVSEGLL